MSWWTSVVEFFSGSKPPNENDAQTQSSAPLARELHSTPPAVAPAPPSPQEPPPVIAPKPESPEMPPVPDTLLGRIAARLEGADVPLQTDVERFIAEEDHDAIARFDGPVAVRLLTASLEIRAETATVAAEVAGGLLMATRVRGEAYKQTKRMCQELYVRLMRDAPLPLSTHQIGRMVAAGDLGRNLTTLVDAAERTPPDATVVEDLLLRVGKSPDLVHRLKRLIDPHPSTLEAGGPLGDRLREWVQDRDDRPAWESLWDHCQSIGDKARANKTWRKTASRLTKQVPFNESVRPLFLEVDPLNILQANERVFRGLVWAVEDPQLAAPLAALAERCFKKVSGFGAANTKLGNAVVMVLGGLGKPGIVQLSRLQGKVRYASARKRIDTSLTEAAQAHDISRDELEEQGVPDFGIPLHGVRSLELAGCVAKLSADPPQLLWVGSRGKPVKSVPQAVKDGAPEELAALKAELKELRQASEAQKIRIERLFLTDRSIPWEAFRTHYLEHPIVSFVASKLLWNVGDQVTLGDTDLSGTRVTPDSDTAVSLFHPLGADPQLLAVWRDRMEEQGIEQPFNQVWREVYNDTPEDAFANRLLRQRRLSTACQRQDWRYATQGYWDGDNHPTRTVGEVTIELDIVPIEHQADDVLFTYVRTGYATIQGDPSDILRSELLRDVDLLTTVAAAEERPEERFGDGGRWWEAMVYGPLSQMGAMRAAWLERILPTISLAAVVDERWLVVGERRIHLGSGVAEGEPISVTSKARSATKKIVLPFEGDPLLATILAKAFATQP